jgi:hypothetical protein
LPGLAFGGHAPGLLATTITIIAGAIALIMDVLELYDSLRKRFKRASSELELRDEVERAGLRSSSRPKAITRKLDEVIGVVCRDR